MPKDHHQDLSVLSEAKRGLLYLTANDWTLIADKAVRMEFKPEECIVQTGRRSHGIYLLVKGSARVEIPSQSSVPAIGPGEVCGELSYLDDLPASANVVAQGPVEAYYLDRPTLQSLFELFPHLASRFYRSLAIGLARRLRDVVAPTSEVQSRKD
jgi:CRP-like cAMP-binding protein